MPIRELTNQEFRDTFREPMRRLGAGESHRPIPLKDYVSECVKSLALPTTLEAIEIHHVYLNGDQSHSHILIYFGEPNRYLVIVVSHKTDSVDGHHLLDLNKQYGLTPQGDST